MRLIETPGLAERVNKLFHSAVIQVAQAAVLRIGSKPEDLGVRQTRSLRRVDLTA